MASGPNVHRVGHVVGHIMPCQSRPKHLAYSLIEVFISVTCAEVVTVMNVFTIREKWFRCCRQASDYEHSFLKVLVLGRER